jgi:protease-4
MWRAIRRLGRDYPLVALLGPQATSGGYYTATACDRIYAFDTTITGSIGVVGGKLVIRGALEKLGVKPVSIGGGELATPSIWEPFGPQERILAQNSLQQDYDGFLDRVREGRGMDQVTAQAAAGGRVFLGREALALGLVDGTGGWQEAWQQICKLSEVKSPEEASLRVFPRPRGWLERMWGSSSEPVTPAGVAAYALGERALSPGHWYLGPIIGWQ